MWESCQTTPLVGGFFRGSPVSPVLSFRRCSILTSITLIGSQDIDVKSRPNLFNHSSLLSIVCIPCYVTRMTQHVCGAPERQMSRGEARHNTPPLPPPSHLTLSVPSCFLFPPARVIPSTWSGGRSYPALVIYQRHDRRGGRNIPAFNLGYVRFHFRRFGVQDFARGKASGRCQLGQWVFLGVLPVIHQHCMPLPVRKETSETRFGNGEGCGTKPARLTQSSQPNWAPVHNVCSVVVTPLESRRATSCGYNSSHPVWHTLYECLQDIHGDSSPFLLKPFHEFSNEFWPRLKSPHPAIQFVPKMFYRVEVEVLGLPVQSANIVVGVPLHIIVSGKFSFQRTYIYRSSPGRAGRNYLLWIEVTLSRKWGRGGIVVSLLASHLGELGSINGGSASFLGDLPLPLLLHSGAAPYSPHFTLIGSQALAVKSSLNIFTHLSHKTVLLAILHKNYEMYTFSEAWRQDKGNHGDWQDFQPHTLWRKIDRWATSPKEREQLNDGGTAGGRECLQIPLPACQLPAFGALQVVLPLSFTWVGGAKYVLRPERLQCHCLDTLPSEACVLQTSRSRRSRLAGSMTMWDVRSCASEQPPRRMVRVLEELNPVAVCVVWGILSTQSVQSYDLIRVLLSSLVMQSAGRLKYDEPNVIYGLYSRLYVTDTILLARAGGVRGTCGGCTSVFADALEPGRLRCCVTTYLSTRCLRQTKKKSWTKRRGGGKLSNRSTLPHTAPHQPSSLHTLPFRLEQEGGACHGSDVTPAAGSAANLPARTPFHFLTRTSRPVVGGPRARAPAPPTWQMPSPIVALKIRQQVGLTRASSTPKMSQRQMKLTARKLYHRNCSARCDKASEQLLSDSHLKLARHLAATRHCTFCDPRTGSYENALATPSSLVKGRQKHMNAYHGKHGISKRDNERVAPSVSVSKAYSICCSLPDASAKVSSRGCIPCRPDRSNDTVTANQSTSDAFALSTLYAQKKLGLFQLSRAQNADITRNVLLGVQDDQSGYRGKPFFESFFSSQTCLGPLLTIPLEAWLCYAQETNYSELAIPEVCVMSENQSSDSRVRDCTKLPSQLRWDYLIGLLEAPSGTGRNVFRKIWTAFSGIENVDIDELYKHLCRKGIENHQGEKNRQNINRHRTLNTSNGSQIRYRVTEDTRKMELIPNQCGQNEKVMSSGKGENTGKNICDDVHNRKRICSGHANRIQELRNRSDAIMDPNPNKAASLKAGINQRCRRGATRQDDSVGVCQSIPQYRDEQYKRTAREIPTKCKNLIFKYLLSYTRMSSICEYASHVHLQENLIITLQFTMSPTTEKILKLKLSMLDGAEIRSLDGQL
ncbi:hypothetical protein PR048_023170 [Dryococelus australis]|uniref:Uncharacterized protein n=1 Tax=Dryococelus australis TaxID=614101 RepID=A0ABQ9GTB7_9NEOP|nr:hypothetical protein PR048_023170 [Dryococelus australis]